MTTACFKSIWLALDGVRKMVEINAFVIIGNPIHFMWQIQGRNERDAV